MAPRSVQAIVNEMVRRWEIEHQERRKQATNDAKPVITISREFGALGASIGKLVAVRLEFQFWDQELVHEMAEQTGIDEAILVSLDEHTRNAIEVMIEGVLRGESCSESMYLRQLMRITHTIGNHGRSVIIGRGAQFILQPDEALRVRAVAPLPQRITGIAERKGLSKAEASRLVHRVEHERIAFVRHHYHRDVFEPSAYDLIINTGTMTVEQGADLVIAAYQARFGAL